MAAPSLLRCGRAAARQALRLDPPTPRCAPSSAALCTRPAGSGTPADGNLLVLLLFLTTTVYVVDQPLKDITGTDFQEVFDTLYVMTPQGSTKLLATKATVEFPKTLSSSSVSPNEGETISSTNLKEASKPSDEDLRALMSRKTVVAFPQRVIVSSIEEEKPTTAATGGGIRKELAEEEESSSSSSSDSDSSSDSEEENDDDDDSEIAIKTRVEFPRRDSKLSEKVTINASKLPKGNLSQKRHKESVAKKKPSKTEPDVSTIETVTFPRTPVGHKTSKSKARDPNVKSAPEEADQPKLALEPHLDENRALTDTALKSDYLEEKATGTQMATTQLKAPSVAQEDKKQNLVSRGEAKRVKEARETEAIEITPEQEETSESAALVMGTKEETVQEAGDQAGESSTIEEPAAAAEPAPEEFDNSTYKNLQHHEYNIYTFVDSVVVLSKFRQPQPSSGRPSPRH